MAYCEWHDTLPGNIKTRRFMAALGIGKVQAVGHLGCFFAYMIGNKPGGYIEQTDIPLAAEWDGDAATFVSALANSGWIEADGAEWHISNWEEYTRGYRKSKLDAKKRKPKKPRVKRAVNALQTRSYCADQNRPEQTRTDQNRPELTPAPATERPRSGGKAGYALQELRWIKAPGDATKYADLDDLDRQGVDLKTVVEWFKANRTAAWKAGIWSFEKTRAPAKGAPDIRVGVAAPSPHATETKEIAL